MYFIQYVHGYAFSTGDTISLHLDLKQGTMKLLVNEKDGKIAFRDIKKSKAIKYRMFVQVSLNNVGDTVEIIDIRSW